MVFARPCPLATLLHDNDLHLSVFPQRSSLCARLRDRRPSQCGAPIHRSTHRIVGSGALITAHPFVWCGWPEHEVTLQLGCLSFECLQLRHQRIHRSMGSFNKPARFMHAPGRDWCQLRPSLRPHVCRERTPPRQFDLRGGGAVPQQRSGESAGLFLSTVGRAEQWSTGLRRTLPRGPDRTLPSAKRGERRCCRGAVRAIQCIFGRDHSPTE